MTEISVHTHNTKSQLISSMEQIRNPWMEYWREVAEVYLPRRYVSLYPSTRGQTKQEYKNTRILDSTGTIALRNLASGMMNGITSPSRQWLRLHLSGAIELESHFTRLALDKRQRTLSTVMAGSNFYNAIATLYIDIALFGTGVVLIYEDANNIIHCYNPPLGEFYLDQGPDYRVNTFARKISLTVRQIVERWGLANCSTTVRDSFQRGGAAMLKDIEIWHLIEPNDRGEGLTALPFQELYWEAGGSRGEVLSVRGYNELPGIFVRWDTVANEPYGTGPSMDALGDVLQLQVETKRKGQAIDKMVSPPVQADVTLKNRPMSFNPNEVTYVNGIQNGTRGVSPVYEVRTPIDALTQDIAQIQARIREVHHNDLFKMIAQLETVRSATEIEARREEKLVLLGPVLERFENEALEPAVKRIMAIADRYGCLLYTSPSPRDRQKSRMPSSA